MAYTKYLDIFTASTLTSCNSYWGAPTETRLSYIPPDLAATALRNWKKVICNVRSCVKATIAELRTRLKKWNVGTSMTTITLSAPRLMAPSDIGVAKGAPFVHVQLPGIVDLIDRRIFLLQTVFGHPRTSKDVVRLKYESLYRTRTIISMLSPRSYRISKLWQGICTASPRDLCCPSP